jgi:TRAP transporter TAXI family solute receptor
MQRIPTHWLKIAAPTALVVLLGFLIAFRFVEPAPPKKLVLAAGPAGGAYAAFAESYREALARHGIDVDILQTTGSVENLDLLASEAADVAFVQSGIGKDTAGPMHFLSLGSLYYEPLWLFHRGDRPLSRLADFAGMRISIGPDTSGSNVLARRLLAHVDPAALGISLLTLPPADAALALQQQQIDALVMVAGPESSLVQELIRMPDIQLMDMRRAAAFARLHPELSALTLPEGIVDLVADLPPRDVRLIAPAANLVVTDQLHPALVDLLLLTARSVHENPDWFSERGSFPGAQHLGFELHDSARRFYEQGPPLLQRYLPFWLATLIDRLKVLLLPLIMLLLPLMRFMPPLYQWRMRSRIYRWYQALERIEAAARSGEQPPAKLLQELARIEAEVARVDVPLAFAGQAYDLRMHVDMVRDRIEASL